jgi:hypothetical protein
MKCCATVFKKIKKKVHSVHSGRRKSGNEALKILLCYSATLPCDVEFSAKL